MRKISASLVCPVSSPAIKRGVVVVDSDGTILEIRGPLEKEEANIEYYSGILIPGLVNAHCHLELSHLKSTIVPSLGMAGFVESIMEKRVAEESTVEHAIQKADRFMYEDGINLVGDISNGNTTFSAKTKSKITYHTFVEAFAPEAKHAQKVIQDKVDIVEEARFKKLLASLTLHAPYSISPEMVSTFNKSTQPDNLISFHLFESQEEIDYMEQNSGPLEQLYRKNGRTAHPQEQWGSSPYKIMLGELPNEHRLLAIHACRATQPYIDMLARFKETWFVLCPRSNQYIHSELPPISLIRSNTKNIALGTDSLASNHSLSILEEMKAITSRYSEITFEELLTWATLNGARALGQESTFGSFDKNKKPGVLLLTGIDIFDPKLSEKTRVRRLV